MESNNQQNISKDWKMYTIGVVLTVISAFIFALWQNKPQPNNEVMIFIHFGIFLFLVFSNSFIKIFRIKTWTSSLATYPIIVSGIISCFALNREMQLFYISTTWWSVFIVVNMAILLFKPLLEFGGTFIKTILYSSLFCSAVILLYYSIILIPNYLFGLIGIIVLGIGIHAFIPLFSFIYITNVLYKEAVLYKYYKKIYLFIFVILFSTVVFYVIRWNVQVNRINTQTQYLELQKEKAIPKWMYIAQRLPNNNESKKILLNNILYPNIDDMFDFDIFGFGRSNSNYNIDKVHDPLVLISSAFSSDINLTENDIIRILESNYDASHLTESRLWRGDDLKTESITTNIRIYPKQRLSYTEKTINIKNNNAYTWNQQEAIYTFYLPEGATVSSLSLWINGVEEKAYLTSKQKAKTAYNTIVGVEKRDPSVVHWQEGNKVSVRIFPCTPQENRKFKLGITAPLAFKDNELSYKNISCKGPDLLRTKEIVQVNFTDTIDNLSKPYFLKKSGTDYLIGKHDYNTWKLSFNAPEIVNGIFHYKDNTYLLSEDKIQHKPFIANNIFLDVNKSWNKTEWNKITTDLSNKNLFVYLNKWIKITADNKQTLYKELKQINFNVLPLYEIKDAAHSIIITKSEQKGPSLKELKDNLYFNYTNRYFINHKLNVINIGDESNAMFKTLKEYSAVQIYNTNLQTAITTIKNNQFPNISTSDSVIHLDNQTKIASIPLLDVPKNAPDHVFRLFAYNQAMHQMTLETIQNDSIAPIAYNLVSDANVVSPISSLIVLETQHDYDRFDIKKDNDALANADIHNDGAVPEPHEWMLIILLLVSVIYINIKSSRYAYLFR
ncbi:MAG: XrtN system VIT domain-containing protein [Chitinophagales bacterium]|nr:XrtN system VIT domain-containing protein [Chitinophagales bacterium]